ncbi:MarR family winged helix-turn-helix transcriptional regulator [Microbacterium indicum]|uniref:MarR family winged helix-turn-helix transcriptional regulator n=1 Tax=Microbacterium indicum TaxID=358100 RepID=UPI000402EF3F|nr:MarR family winged helix-turn-helix transcriptional regulator [Microbacterium indicum]
MTDEAPRTDELDSAVRGVEEGLSAIFGQFRRLLRENAERFQPGMLPTTYKMYTAIVRRSPVTARQLAEWLDMDKGHVSRAVRELEELDLLVRTPDPDDGRVFLIEPTPDGVKRLEEARLPYESFLHDRLATWPVADIARLADLLHELTTPGA